MDPEYRLIRTRTEARVLVALHSMMAGGLLILALLLATLGERARVLGLVAAAVLLAGVQGVILLGLWVFRRFRKEGPRGTLAGFFLWGVAVQYQLFFAIAFWYEAAPLLGWSSAKRRTFVSLYAVSLVTGIAVVAAVVATRETR